MKHTHGHLLEKFQAKKSDHILDASSGTGILAEEIVQAHGPFHRLVLNDPAHKMLDKAKQRLSAYPNIEYTNCFCEDLRFEPNSFDKIICLNAFHYYTAQEKILNYFHTFLKPGGELYVLDWNRKGLFTVANFLIDLLTPENINTRSSEEMSSLLTRTGFTVQEKDKWSFRWWNFFYLKCKAAKD